MPLIDIKEENKFLNEFKIINNKKNKSREEFKKLFLKYPDYRLPCYMDSLFKELFKIRSYTAKVISFFIPLEYEYIKDNMIIDNPEINIANIFHRRSIADTLITIDDYYILLECNMYKSKELITKNLHTFNGVSYSMINRGEEISNKKAIMISFDNFDRYDDSELVYNSLIKEEKKGWIESENYKIYHVNLEMARNILYNINDIARLNEKERVLGFIVNMDKRVGEKLGEEESMYEANQVMNEKCFDFGSIVMRSYDAYDTSIYNKGQRAGEKIGEKRGEKRGLKRGFKRGFIKQAIETAKKMLKKGMDIDTISELTDLEKKKIEELKKENIKN